MKYKKNSFVNCIKKFFILSLNFSLVVSLLYSAKPFQDNILLNTKSVEALGLLHPQQKVIFLTTAGSNLTWTVPNDWSDNNKIELIGAGGGGRAGSTAGGKGGGGGAYVSGTVTGLTPGGSVTYRVGAGGAGGVTAGTSGANGGDTFFNRTGGSANTCADTVSLCAKGGTGATSASAGGVGGAVASNKPANVGFAGGNGGSGNNTGDTSGGGGGAAGPNGIGRNGGAGQALAPGAGGGGGGANGGAVGSAGSGNGGAGGNNFRGANGGAGAINTTNTLAIAGTNGGGGGGGSATTTNSNIRAGADGGGNGGVWTSTHESDGVTPSVVSIGPGGGGGGGGATTGVGTGSAGGNGGTYGGGGGGAYQNAGSGGQGVIVITYVPNSVIFKTVFLTSLGTNTWTVPNDWSDDNEIIVLGAGGGGRAGSTNGAGGGGGGAIATGTVTGLTPGGSVTYRVGAGGSGGVAAGTSGADGGDTFFNRTGGSANTCADTVSVCAKGGLGATSATGASGGSIANNKPAFSGFAGGTGGTGNSTGDTGGGGGGAASPYGAGRSGGAGQGAAPGAGGGGGGVGGAGLVGSGNGGNGGVNFAGTGDGAGAINTTNTLATAGTNGGGGGGGSATTTNSSIRAGANGSDSIVWTQTSDNATIGPGGGGGGGGATTGVGTGSAGGNGGFGGGGGGAYQNAGSGGSGFIIIRYVPSSVTTIDIGTDPASATVAPESAIVDAGAFTLQTSAGTDSITALTVILAGSGTPYDGVSEVRITSNDGSATYYSAISNPISNTLNFSGGTPIPVSNTQTQFKIRITPKTHANMPAVPGAEYALSPYVSDFTSGNSYEKSGTDTNSNTLTIDNLSPSNVTSATATSGNTQVSLAWTNPADSDLSQIIVLRRASTATSDTPTEGASYSVGNTIGDSTVACVVSSPTANCTDTGLINGTAYHYRIYAKDSRGNYSQTGVVPTGSPATPAVPGRYWVGGGSSANWNATGPTNWSSTPGGSNNASVPGPSDDVFFTSHSSAASTLSASITVNSLDMTGYTGTLTHNASVTLTIDSLNSEGHSLRLASGMTYTLGDAASSAITFTSTSGTGKITTAGKTLGNVTFDGVGGTWQLQDTMNSVWPSRTVLTAGTFDTNSQTVSISKFLSNNSNVRTLTLGNSTLNIGGDNTSGWDTTSVTNLTVTANTATVNFNSSATPVFISATKDWNGMSLTRTNIFGGTFRLNAGSSTFNNLTFTGYTSKTEQFIFSGNPTVTGTFTVNGNSSINRVLVTSDTPGTARTITAANVSVTNADFQDITGAGAGNWNLSAITGLSGDAGGNSGITFTTPQTQYWTGNTGNWSDATQWCTTSGGCADNAGNGRVPLPQDDVVFDNGSFNGTSQTATLDMPRAGRNIDWSAYNEGQTPTWSRTGSAPAFYGSITLISGMNLNNNGYNERFENRGAITLTSAGKTWHNPTFSMVGGTVTLQDDFAIAGAINLTDGTFDANDFNVTAPAGVWLNFSTRTRALTMGSGTWTLSRNDARWNASTVTGLTLNSETSTIIISDTSSAAKTFEGGGLTYNNVTITGSNVTFTGSNTFNNLALNTAGQAIGTKFTAGTTQTLEHFYSNGSAGNLVYASSTSASATATLAKAGGGTICVDYMHLTWMTGSPADTWYVGANSTNGGNNSGLIFDNCATVSISGTVYTTLGGSNVGTGVTIKAYRNGSVYVGSDTTDSNGVYTISDGFESGDIVTVYIETDLNYTTKGNTIFKTNGDSISNLDIFGNYLTLGYNSGTSITNTNLHTGAVYNLSDLLYSTSTSNSISVASDIGINVLESKAYLSGGATTISGSGSLYLQPNSSANFDYTTTVGGNVYLGTNSLIGGTGNITVNGGGVTGDGTINMTGGNFTVGGTGNFGGDTNWTFNELTLGTTGTNTTTATGSGSITVATTTISGSQTLNAGSKTWYLTSSYEPLTISGTLSPNTSTFIYQGVNNTTLPSATFYNLSFTPPSGTPVYSLPEAPLSSDWYNENWSYRKSITIDNTKVSGSANLTDFPVLIDITDADLSAEALSNGYDILFTSADGTTKLAHEIELYTNSTGRLTAWVKIPTLSYNTDTEIYMYYGNSGASDQQNKTGVWDSNFVGIYHLPDGSTLTANDSTSNSNNGTVTTFMAGNGKIDGGASADGLTGRISIGSGSSSLNLGSQAITISAWIRPSSMGENNGGRIIEKVSGYIFFKDNLNTTNGLAFSANGLGGADLRFTGANVLTPNSWNYVTVTYNNSNAVIFYVNGSQVSSQSYGTALTNNTNEVYLGNRPDDARTFDGTFDEVRISKIVRSPDWIATEYNNQSATSTFYSIGSEETPGLGYNTLNVLNNLYLDGSANTTLDLNTNDTLLVVGNNLTIGGGDTLSAPSIASITIGGNLTNYGTFVHNNGTVILNKNTASIITSTGDMSFNDLVINTPGKTVEFQSHTSDVPSFTFNGQFTVTGQEGSPIYIQSNSAGNQWLVYFSTPQTSIQYAYIKDSACALGSLSVLFNITNSGGGNNGACWNLTNRGADGKGTMTSTDMGRGYGILQVGGFIHATIGTDDGGPGGGGGQGQGGGGPGGGGGGTP